MRKTGLNPILCKMEQLWICQAFDSRKISISFWMGLHFLTQNLLATWGSSYIQDSYSRRRWELWSRKPLYSSKITFVRNYDSF